MKSECYLAVEDREKLVIKGFFGAAAMEGDHEVGHLVFPTVELEGLSEDLFAEFRGDGFDLGKEGGFGASVGREERGWL
jgi:hypothetical protein